MLQNTLTVLTQINTNDRTLFVYILALSGQNGSHIWNSAKVGHARGYPRTPARAAG